MNNNDIREAAKKANVKLWQVAAAYGMQDSNFSKKLRVELPKDEKEKILGLIAKLAKREG